MWIIYLSMLLVLFPNISESYSRNDLRNSHLPFRYELEQVTTEFQEKLRKQLSNLEMEMYTEFLQFLQEIDGNQTVITDGLTDHLSEQVNTFLEKFTKVMVYSSERIENLKDNMNSLSTSLKSSAKERLTALFKNLDRIRAVTGKTPNERSKRHTNHLGKSKVATPSPTLSEANKILQMDPDDLSVQDDDEFTNLHSSNYFDGHMNDKDSDFTLRDVSSGPTSKFLLLKNSKPRQGTEAPPKTDVLPRNCFDLLMMGYTKNGVYVIYPSGKGTGIEVWCEQTSAGGGWTVLLGRNMNQHFLNFTRMPIQYIHGFGKASANHWIGLEVMHLLTQGISNTLRVQINDENNTDHYAIYEHFRVRSHKNEYAIDVGGYSNSSKAPDALTVHSGKPFSYPFHESGTGCTHTSRVGWWYLEEPECYQALPTLQEYPSVVNQTEDNAAQQEWEPWKGLDIPVKSIQFMVSPSFVRG